jgi:hypothetical protein
MKVHQEDVTAAVAAVRSAARGDDAAAAEEALRLAKLAAPDCVTFLRNVVRAERSGTPTQRVRSAVALLEVAGFLSGIRPSGAFPEPEGADGGGGAGETS